MKPKIAVLPGDGIGKEIVPEAVKVLKAVGQKFHHAFEFIEAPGVEVSIDVDEGVLSFGTRRAAFPLEPFARYCLRSGLDELAFLLSREREIAAYERQAGPAPWRSS